MNIENIEAVLLSLKEQALEATKNGDGDFYQNYLDDSAVAIVPFGVFNKDAIVQQMSSGKSMFKSSGIDDTRVMVLTSESGIVTYKATYDTMKDDIKTSFSVFVTTVYVKKDGQWKGVFYQQTPLSR